MESEIVQLRGITDKELSKIPNNQIFLNPVENFFNSLINEYQRRQFVETQYTNKHGVVVLPTHQKEHKYMYDAPLSIKDLDSLFGLKKPHCLPPPLSVASHILTDIFSYNGYDSVDSLRKNSVKDQKVAELIEKKLYDGPATIIEIGTYDGKRTRDILSQVRNKDNIAYFIGAEINSKSNEAEKELKSIGIPSKIFNQDFNGILSHFQNLPGKKIYLGLENVLFNLSYYDGDYATGVSKVLANMLNENDSIIIESLREYDPSKYNNGVDELFEIYFNNSGIKNITGGKLVAKGNDIIGRSTFITGMNPQIVYDNNTFNFSSKHYRLFGKDNYGDVEIFEPSIHLISSKLLTKNHLFGFLYQSWGNGITADSVSKISGNYIMDFTKKESSREEAVGYDVLDQLLFSSGHNENNYHLFKDNASELFIKDNSQFVSDFLNNSVFPKFESAAKNLNIPYLQKLVDYHRL